MESKICKQCQVEKPLTEYYIRNKKERAGRKEYIDTRCKTCCSDISKASYEKNKEHRRAYKKEYNQREKDKINTYARKYSKKKRATDPAWKLKANLRARLYKLFSGRNKSKSTQELTGCDIDFLMSYIESKFKSGMSWQNYGDWHIDHIKPCSTFDLTDPKQQEECFHYTNLQPLWAEENWKKNNRIVDMSSSELT
jgi:hypothetical protein